VSIRVNPRLITSYFYGAGGARDSKDKGDAVKTPQYIAGLTG